MKKSNMSQNLQKINILTYGIYIIEQQEQQTYVKIQIRYIMFFLIKYDWMVVTKLQMTHLHSGKSGYKVG